jgi:hypothetical protein
VCGQIMYSRKKLEKRLSYLYSGELLSIIGFILTSFIINKAYPHLKLYSLFSFWISFFLLEFILLQGSLYWYVKLKRLKEENTSVTPTHIILRLKYLKKWNIGLIVISPCLFIIDLLVQDPPIPGGLFIASFIYIIAIIEYINYFHIQLSYDNVSDIKFLIKSKKFKKATLAKEFERIK